LFEMAMGVSAMFERIASAKPNDDFGFFARVGTSPVPYSRSIRRDLPDLMHTP